MRRAIPILVALLLLAIPGPAATADSAGPTSCGGSWSSAETKPPKCMLRYWGGSVGVGLTIYGDPGAVGVVRLMGPSRTVPGVQEELMECAAVGTEWGGGCGGVKASNKALVPLGSWLTCMAENVSDRGSYGCSTSGP